MKTKWERAAEQAQPRRGIWPFNWLRKRHIVAIRRTTQRCTADRENKFGPHGLITFEGYDERDHALAEDTARNCDWAYPTPFSWRVLWNRIYVWWHRKAWLRLPQTLMDEQRQKDWTTSWQARDWRLDSKGQPKMVDLRASLNESDGAPHVDKDFWKRQEIGLGADPALEAKLIAEGIHPGHKANL